MKQFKQSPVIFDEESHTYQLDGKKLLGITGLIHSILGLGIYPEASEYVKNYLIPRAGSRGTAVHHAIQTYDELGIRQTTQIVSTLYGDTIREDEWDVSFELDCYIKHLDGFKPLANELTVSDNVKYASQIDNIWMREQTGGIWLVDTKTNNTTLYPTCGYYSTDYFSNGEDALKEYLSWQLSVYAVLFEDENPGLKVEGLACNWLRKDTSAFWVIERKPDALVRELLSSEYVILDNGPVFFHHDLTVFGIGDQLPTKQKNQLPDVPQDVISYVADLLTKEKELKQKLDDAKKALRAAMEQHDVKSCDLGLFRATIAADSERTTFDSAKFKREYPQIYKKYITKKTTKGGFTIKLKDND